MRISVIIAAGGQGTRFSLDALRKNAGSFQKSEQTYSKLFYSLKGKTILETSIEKFLTHHAIQEIIVAVPPAAMAWMRKKIREKRWRKVRAIAGGRTRSESVYLGLKNVKARSNWVMVHDGARPLITQEAIAELIRQVQGYDGAILAKPVVPTIKQIDAGQLILHTVDRTQLVEAETPQLAKKVKLLEAYRNLDKTLHVTDEAGLLESVGSKVKVVTHREWNPKITTFNDYEQVKQSMISSSKEGQMRMGIGKDTHRLEKGRKMMLGGLQIPCPFGPVGHSDGDPLLHAIADAILGALAEGDIGQWFSDKDKRFKNLPSSKILKFCADMLHDRGWLVSNLDTIVHLEQPKLGPWKEKIRIHIAKLLGINKDQVSIKAKTMEGLGAVGEGRAVSADAVVMLKRSES